MRRYLWNLFIAIDQLFNALFLGNPDETISSRMGKKIKNNKCFVCKCICKLLDLIDKNHCIDSIEEDEKAIECWK